MIPSFGCDINGADSGRRCGESDLSRSSRFYHKVALTPGNAKLIERAGLFIVLGAALAVYAGGLRGFFVQDDFGWLETTRFRGLNEYLPCFFQFNPALTYRPLTQETFFWLGQKIFGMWPAGFHGVSLITHLLGATLLYVLLRTFFSPLPCLTGTLFYSVHSAHFTSVYWISAFPEPMALVFYLAALILFIRFDRGGSRGSYAFSLAAMALGIMSKESILSLPLVLGAYCLLVSRRRLVWTLPYFFLSLLYVSVRAGSPVVQASPYPLTFGWEAWNNLMAYLSWAAGFSETLLKVKFQWNLERSYPLAAAAFVASFAALVWFSRDKRIALFSVIWFVAALQPVLYFSQHIYPYYLAPALAAISLLIASALPPGKLTDKQGWIWSLAIVVFISWVSHHSIKLEGRWWNERTFVGRSILTKMPAVARQVPEGRIACIFGFSRDEFGIMQSDAAFKAYGFPTERFILMGLDDLHPGQIRTLKRTGGLQDYYGFIYWGGDFVNSTEQFRRDPEPFLAGEFESLVVQSHLYNDGSRIRLEVSAPAVRAGKDYLTIRVVNFDILAVDILYSLDGRPMPPLIGWQLDGSRSATVFVDKSTPKGIYHYKALRDSGGSDPERWIPVDVQVIVK
jgi:Dolichyl-phosphate-mannose-protein mannosyltransferase